MYRTEARTSASIRAERDTQALSRCLSPRGFGEEPTIPPLLPAKTILVTISCPLSWISIHTLHPGYRHIHLLNTDRRPPVFSTPLSLLIAHCNSINSRSLGIIASMSLTPIRDYTSSNIHNGSGRGLLVLRRSPRERLWVDYDPALDDWLG